MLKLQIIKCLDRVEGDGLSATTLRCEMEVTLRRRPGESELATALKELQNDGLLVTDTDDLTGDTIYKLTPAGTARARH